LWKGWLSLLCPTPEFFICPHLNKSGWHSASTDPIMASALVMAFYTTCSAILTQIYGKSLEQLWHIFLFLGLGSLHK
jgi:hypothetical protein